MSTTRTSSCSERPSPAETSGPPSDLQFTLQTERPSARRTRSRSRSFPGRSVVRALIAGLAENFGTWPLIGVAERIHPARGDLPKLAGNPRALAQATWRHVLFAVVVGVLEERLNQGLKVDVPEVPVSSNGHGDIEFAVGAAT